MKSPLYGKADAGAIWNRTFNNTLESEGYKRSEHDPCVYTKVVGDNGRVTVPLYVDDGSIRANPDEPSQQERERITAALHDVTCKGLAPGPERLPAPPLARYGDY